MFFYWLGERFDTEAMIPIPRSGKAMGIYMTTDHTQVFAAYMFPEGVNVVRVQGSALADLAAASNGNPHLLIACERDGSKILVR